MSVDHQQRAINNAVHQAAADFICLTAKLAVQVQQAVGKVRFLCCWDLASGGSLSPGSFQLHGRHADHSFKLHFLIHFVIYPVEHVHVMQLQVRCMCTMTD